MKTGLAAALAIPSIIFLWPATADAKPKKKIFGCSIAQLQSPAAAPCLLQGDQDIIHGRPTTHQLYCSSTGKLLCCEVDGNGSIVDHSCATISSVKSRAPRGGLKVAPGVPRL